MGKLSNIDNAAAKKGSAINTLWQFIKFIVVSLGAFVIQTVLPIIIQLFMKEEFINQAYSFFVFSSVGGEKNGLGFFNRKQHCRSDCFVLYQPRQNL